MKIAVLGASLSAQTINHKDGEVTGFVEAFRRQYSGDFQLQPQDIVQFAYGGNRLSDAGLIQLEELILSRPDVCIVEPIVEDTSRGREANEQEYLYVFKRLIDNNIFPIVFCVPLPLTKNVLKSQRAVICHDICSKYNIPIKTIDPLKATDDGLVFNGLHTDNSTAYFLASELAIFMREINFGTARENVTKFNIPSNIKVNPINSFYAKKILSMSIGFRAGVAGRLKLIQKQKVGPFSPVLNTTLISNTSNISINREVNSVWDRYCYYQRSSYVTLCDLNVEAGAGIVLIDIAATQPNYNKCSKFEGTWPNVHELRLEPLGAIFSISNCDITYNDVDIVYDV